MEETYAVSYPVAAELGGAPMLRRLPVRWLIPLTVVVSLLPACSDSADEASEATLALATTTEVATTTTTAPTTTVASDEEAMVIVGFGGLGHEHPQSVCGSASRLCRHGGRGVRGPVDVRDYAQMASKPTQLITTLDSEMVQASLEEADVVLVEIPQRDTQWPFQAAVGWGGSGPAECGGG